MSKRKQVFEDGSYVEWENREGVRYVENGFIALVWVDYDPRLFSSKRIIKLSSLSTWHEKPDQCPETIDSEKKNEILEKVKQYFEKIDVEIENDLVSS